MTINLADHPLSPAEIDLYNKHNVIKMEKWNRDMMLHEIDATIEKLNLDVTPEHREYIHNLSDDYLMDMLMSGAYDVSEFEDIDPDDFSPTDEFIGVDIYELERLIGRIDDNIAHGLFYMHYTFAGGETE